MKSNYLVLGAAIFVVVLLLVFLFVTSNKKAKLANSEKFYAGELDAAAGLGESVAARSPANPDMASSGVGSFGPSDPLGNEMYNPVDAPAATPTPSCFPRDRLGAEDLLPKDAANSKWAQMNPAGQGDVRDQNFLSAGHHIGVDTVGSSMKNANHQLRSDPAIPIIGGISPWGISTIAPNMNQKMFEIGSS